MREPTVPRGMTLRGYIATLRRALDETELAMDSMTWFEKQDIDAEHRRLRFELSILEERNAKEQLQES